MDVVSILTLVVLAMFFYTFIPERAWTGLGPIVRACADLIRALSHAILNGVHAALCWVFDVARDEEASVKSFETPPPAVLSTTLRDTNIDTSIISAISTPPNTNLTERELVRLLATQKTLNTWRFSGNAIYALVKGNRNDVMAIIREARGGGATVEPEADDEIVTPFAGRRTKASYYMDDPELEYQPPAKV